MTNKFREYSAKELVLELAGTSRNDPDVPVSIEVQRADGTVLSTELVMLHVGYGHDTDRSGGYRWVKITAREEA